MNDQITPAAREAAQNELRNADNFYAHGIFVQAAFDKLTADLRAERDALRLCVANESAADNQILALDSLRLEVEQLKLSVEAEQAKAKGLVKVLGDVTEEKERLGKERDEVEHLRSNNLSLCHKLVNECDQLRAENAALTKQVETLANAASQTDRAIAKLFWTTDDGLITRDGTPEDPDAPLFVCEAWKDLRTALASVQTEGASNGTLQLT